MQNKGEDKLETTAKGNHPTCSMRKMAIKFGVLCTLERRAIVQKRKHVQSTKSLPWVFQVWPPNGFRVYQSTAVHVASLPSPHLACNQKKKRKRKKKRNVLNKVPCVTWGPFTKKKVRILSTYAAQLHADGWPIGV